MVYKSFFVSLFILFGIRDCIAQIELRSNPLATFIGNVNISIDYHLSRDVSLELYSGLDSGTSIDFGSGNNNFQKEDAYQIRFSGKYYYAPLRGSDRVFSSLIVSHKRAKGQETSITGIDLNFKQNSITSGFGLGYKWRSYSGLVLELSTGYERSLFIRRKNTVSNQVTKDHLTQQIFLIISIGYSFNRKMSRKR